MKKFLFASVVWVLMLSGGTMAQEGNDRRGELGAAVVSRFTETETQKIKDFFSKRASDLARGQQNVEDKEEDEEESREEESQSDSKANKSKNTDKSSKGKGQSADRGRGRGRGAKAAQGGRPS